MYLTEARLYGIKCFEEIRLGFNRALPSDQDRTKNWNVILGENGSGKTTLLQAIAAGLMDVATAQKALDVDGWVRRTADFGTVLVQLEREASDKKDGAPRSERKTRYHSTFALADGGREISVPGESPMYFATPTLVEPQPRYAAMFDVPDLALSELVDETEFMKRHWFGPAEVGGRGWLACGYGAFRREAGFTTESATIEDILRKRFITLFEEGAALFDCTTWLKEMDRKQSRSRKGSRSRRMFREILDLIPALLPHVDEVLVEDEVQFRWKGRPVGLGGLSDGYRSMFVLITDILRWAEHHRPQSLDQLQDISGVVLIDEVDTHLHPKWQREAGFLLTRTFPNLQFIVTTHSPFVAMAAAKGGLTVLHQDDEGVVTAERDVPFVRGWSIGRVLEEVFGLNSLTDPDTAEKLERYQELRAQRGALSEPDQETFKELETELDRRMASDAGSPSERLREEQNAVLLKLLRGEDATP